MDHDRKSPVLKTLQGEIWARGYADRSLRGEVFADVPQAMARWRAEGIGVAIYSSGSVLAQRLRFQTTDHGDLTTYIGAFFDTGVGPKREADSYRRIAATLGSTPETLLFLSDTPAELQAARAAGFNVRLCVRPPHDPPADNGFDVITDFSEVL